MLKSLDPATHFSYNWFSIFWIRELWTCQGYLKAELCLNGFSSGPIDMLFKSCEHTPTFQVRKSHFPFYIPLYVKRLKGRQELSKTSTRTHIKVSETQHVSLPISKSQRQLSLLKYLELVTSAPASLRPERLCSSIASSPVAPSLKMKRGQLQKMDYSSCI